MEVEIVNFIVKNSTALSFIFGTLLLAVNYISNQEVQKFQDNSIRAQEDAKKFQDASIAYQQEAKTAQDKNTELIRELLDNASNPELLSKRLLELRTEWLKKISKSSPVNPDIEHIIKAINEIKREQEEIELTQEENLSSALKHHELFAIPIWSIVTDIFYQRALLLEKSGLLKNVKKYDLVPDKTARKVFYGQTHDFKKLISADITESGKELNVQYSRELYPLSKDPKSKFGSISSFITFKPETQIVLNVTQKIIRISSPKSELVIPTTELADNIDEFSRITAETFDDYLIQQISRQTKN